jgi:hypothetical protein
MVLIVTLIFIAIAMYHIAKTQIETSEQFYNERVYGHGEF